MAEGITMHSPVPATATTSEPSQPVQSVLHPSQTESEPVTVERARAGAHVDYPEAPNPKPPVAPSTESSIDQAVAASAPEAPVDSQVEQAKAMAETKNEEPKKEEPQVGEKRDLGSTTTPVPAPAPAPTSITEDKKEPAPEGTEEPEAKKQKLESNAESGQEAKEPTDPNPVAPATAAATDDTNGHSKKEGRPKKEKVKEAVKKAIPTDGIGSRTRSRTKAT